MGKSEIFWIWRPKIRGGGRYLFAQNQGGGSVLIRLPGGGQGSTDPPPPDPPLTPPPGFFYGSMHAGREANRTCGKYSLFCTIYQARMYCYTLLYGRHYAIRMLLLNVLLKSG